MNTAVTTTGPGRAGVRQTWRETPNPARLLLVGTFVNRLGGFLQVFVVLYLVDRGFSSAQAAVALGSYGAGSVLGMVAGGGLSDRYGARRTIAVSMAGSAVLLLAVLYLDSYPAKVLMIAAVGAVSQAYRPAAASALSALVPVDRQVLVFAMNRLAINLGTTALPLLGVVLISISYSLLFWAEAAVALGYGVLAAVALSPGGPAAPPATGVSDGVAGASDGAAGTSPGTDGPAARGHARGLLADRGYLMFLAALFGLSLIYVQYLAVLPLAIRERGLGTTVYALLIAVNGVMVIAFELLVATVVQRWQARTAVVAGMVLTAIGLSLYAPAWGVAGFIAATVVWSLGEIVGAPTTYFAYPANAGPPSHRGRYLGAANAVYGLGTALGPVVGVLLWTRTGDAVWWWCGVIGLLAALVAHAGVRLRGSTSMSAEER